MFEDISGAIPGGIPGGTSEKPFEFLLQFLEETRSIFHEYQLVGLLGRNPSHRL